METEDNEHSKVHSPFQDIREFLQSQRQRLSAYRAEAATEAQLEASRPRALLTNLPLTQFSRLLSVWTSAYLVAEPVGHEEKPTPDGVDPDCLSAHSNSVAGSRRPSVDPHASPSIDGDTISTSSKQIPSKDGSAFKSSHSHASSGKDQPKRPKPMIPRGLSHKVTDSLPLAREEFVRLATPIVVMSQSSLQTGLSADYVEQSLDALYRHVDVSDSNALTYQDLGRYLMDTYVGDPKGDVSSNVRPFHPLCRLNLNDTEKAQNIATRLRYLPEMDVWISVTKCNRVNIYRSARSPQASLMMEQGGLRKSSEDLFHLLASITPPFPVLCVEYIKTKSHGMSGMRQGKQLLALGVNDTCVYVYDLPLEIANAAKLRKQQNERLAAWIANFDRQTRTQTVQNGNPFFAVPSKFSEIATYVNNRSTFTHSKVCLAAAVTAMAWLDDAQRLVCGSHLGSIFICHAEQIVPFSFLTLVAILNFHTGVIRDICTLTNNRFASCSSDGSVAVFDLPRLYAAAEKVDPAGNNTSNDKWRKEIWKEFTLNPYLTEPDITYLQAHVRMFNLKHPLLMPTVFCQPGFTGSEESCGDQGKGGLLKVVFDTHQKSIITMSREVISIFVDGRPDAPCFILSDSRSPHTAALVDIFLVGSSSQLVSVDCKGFAKMWDMRLLLCVASFELLYDYVHRGITHGARNDHMIGTEYGHPEVDCRGHEGPAIRTSELEMVRTFRHIARRRDVATPTKLQSVGGLSGTLSMDSMGRLNEVPEVVVCVAYDPFQQHMIVNTVGEAHVWELDGAASATAAHKAHVDQNPLVLVRHLNDAHNFVTIGGYGMRIWNEDSGAVSHHHVFTFSAPHANVRTTAKRESQLRAAEETNAVLAVDMTVAVCACLDCDSNARRAFVAVQDGAIAIIRLDTGDVIQQLDTLSSIEAFEQAEKHKERHALRSPRPSAQSLLAFSREVTAMAFMKRERKLVVGTADGYVLLHSIDARGGTNKSHTHCRVLSIRNRVTCIAYIESCCVVLVGDSVGCVHAFVISGASIENHHLRVLEVHSLSSFLTLNRSRRSSAAANATTQEISCIVRLGDYPAFIACDTSGYATVWALRPHPYRQHPLARWRNREHITVTPKEADGSSSGRQFGFVPVFTTGDFIMPYTVVMGDELGCITVWDLSDVVLGFTLRRITPNRCTAEYRCRVFSSVPSLSNRVIRCVDAMLSNSGAITHVQFIAPSAILSTDVENNVCVHRFMDSWADLGMLEMVRCRTIPGSKVAKTPHSMPPFHGLKGCRANWKINQITATGVDGESQSPSHPPEQAEYSNTSEHLNASEASSCSTFHSSMESTDRARRKSVVSPVVAPPPARMPDKRSATMLWALVRAAFDQRSAKLQFRPSRKSHRKTTESMVFWESAVLAVVNGPSVVKWRPGDRRLSLANVGHSEHVVPNDRTTPGPGAKSTVSVLINQPVNTRVVNQVSKPKVNPSDAVSRRKAKALAKSAGSLGVKYLRPLLRADDVNPVTMDILHPEMSLSGNGKPTTSQDATVLRMLQTINWEPSTRHDASEAAMAENIMTGCVDDDPDDGTERKGDSGGVFLSDEDMITKAQRLTKDVEVFANSAHISNLRSALQNMEQQHSRLGSSPCSAVLLGAGALKRASQKAGEIIRHDVHVLRRNEHNVIAGSIEYTSGLAEPSVELQLSESLGISPGQPIEDVGEAPSSDDDVASISSGSSLGDLPVTTKNQLAIRRVSHAADHLAADDEHMDARSEDMNPSTSTPNRKSARPRFRFPLRPGSATQLDKPIIIPFSPHDVVAVPRSTQPQSLTPSTLSNIDAAAANSAQRNIALFGEPAPRMASVNESMKGAPEVPSNITMEATPARNEKDAKSPQVDESDDDDLQAYMLGNPSCPSSKGNFSRASNLTLPVPVANRCIDQRAIDTAADRWRKRDEDLAQDDPFFRAKLIHWENTKHSTLATVHNSLAYWKQGIELMQSVKKHQLYSHLGNMATREKIRSEKKCQQMEEETRVNIRKLLGMTNHASQRPVYAGLGDESETKLEDDPLHNNSFVLEAAMSVHTSALSSDQISVRSTILDSPRSQDTSSVLSPHSRVTSIPRSARAVNNRQVGGRPTSAPLTRQTGAGRQQRPTSAPLVRPSSKSAAIHTPRSVKQSQDSALTSRHLHQASHLRLPQRRRVEAGHELLADVTDLLQVNAIATPTLLHTPKTVEPQARTADSSPVPVSSPGTVYSASYVLGGMKYKSDPDPVIMTVHNAATTKTATTPQLVPHGRGGGLHAHTTKSLFDNAVQDYRVKQMRSQTSFLHSGVRPGARHKA